MAELSDKGPKKYYSYGVRHGGATTWLSVRQQWNIHLEKTNQATLENVFCYIRAIQETLNGLALRASIRHSWERIYSSGVERCQGIRLRRTLLPLIWWKTTPCANKMAVKAQTRRCAPDIYNNVRMEYRQSMGISLCL